MARGVVLAAVPHGWCLDQPTRRRKRRRKKRRWRPSPGHRCSHRCRTTKVRVPALLSPPRARSIFIQSRFAHTYWLDVDGYPAWSPRLTNTSHTAYASVCLSSNRWPGAHAFAVSKQFANVYIGWAQKYSPEPYRCDLSPPACMHAIGPRLD